LQKEKFKMHFLRLIIAAATLLALANSADAFAYADKPEEPNQSSFVSINGHDVHPCTRKHPCRSFETAIARTLPNGEVIALDTGEYSAFTVSKSVIVHAAQGVTATIAPTSGAAVTVAAGTSDTVVLRNLFLSSQGADTGVDFQSGRTLHIENCVINGFSLRGVNADRNVAGDTLQLFIKDTAVRNGASTAVFIRNLGSGGLIKASIDRSRVENNGSVASGIFAGDNARVSVRDSVSGGNGFGFAARSENAGQTAEMNLESCSSTNNKQDGLRAGGGAGAAIIRVSNSTINGNTANGVFQAVNGSILSRGNNTLEGNGGLNAFAGAYEAK
jgi:hypothetical protein